MQMSGANLPSQISSELQDRIDDVHRIQPKHKTKAKRYEEMQQEIIDELLPPQTGNDDQDSQITFNVNNLNYVKKKLFDPEIQYLTKKFKEQLQEESEKL